MSQRQTPSTPKARPQSLEDFMRAKARSRCPVCALAPEIRAQLGRPASDLGYTREDQVEWLRNAVGATTVDLNALTKHLNGKHDQQEDTGHAQA